MRSALFAVGSALTLAATTSAGHDPHSSPWNDRDLSGRQVAVHLLNRFAFGPRPGDVETVLDIGPADWFEAQLAAGDDAGTRARLSRLRTSDMTAEQIARTYPNPGLVFREAREAGLIPPDLDPRSLTDTRQRDLKREVIRFAFERGYRRQRELRAEMLDQKLIRTIHAEAQLREVLTDFWSNHFTTSIADPETRPWILSLERDAIRPHALASFRELLGAVARHPAMLLYLDAFRSGADMGADTTMAMRARSQLETLGSGWTRRAASRRLQRAIRGQRAGANAPTGLNENYARELLELHTLGVDGGYTQHDVVEVARAFTGWGVLPPGRIAEQAERHLRRVETVGGLGFVRDGSFLFRADLHDAGAKQVLGHTISAGGGIDDGERVLDLLAAHPATARHVATRLCQRFVADEPPAALTLRVAAAFSASGGDIPTVMRTIFEAPELWAEAGHPGKIKSPLELVASSVRALDGEVRVGRELARRVEDMGQPLYAASSPAGFPETGDGWLGADALVQRMKFAVDLGAGRIAGVSTIRLTESDAVQDWSVALLPGHDADDFSRQLAAADGSAAIQPAALVLGSPAFQRR